MLLSDFGVSFAMFCIERSKLPVSPDVLVILIERFAEGRLARSQGEVVIRLNCTYTGDIASFEKKYRGMYDFY